MIAPRYEAGPVTGDDLEDMGIEPPIKYRRLLVEMVSVHEVWVEDYDDLGPEGLAKRENADGMSYELVEKGNVAIDGWSTCRAPESWETSDYPDQLGPWPVCPFEGCETVSRPSYGADPTCWRHEVRTGYDAKYVPERTFAEAS